MLRFARIANLVILMQGGVVLSASAQGFNRRFDPIASGNAQFSWAIEQTLNGNIVVVHNQLPWIDSLYYNSRTAGLLLSGTGATISDSLLDTPYRDAFPGWSNPTVTLPNGMIVGGGGTNDSTETHRILLYRFGPDGTPIGHIEIQPTNNSWIGYQLKDTPDGGFIIVGVTDVIGGQDNFLVKTDSLGNVEWWQTYGHPTRLDGAVTVDHAPNGGYYIGGTYPVTAQNRVKWVMRVDSLGNTIWSEFPGTPYNDTFSAHVTTVADGGLVFASGDWSGSIQNHFPQLAKMDTAGNVVWDKKYGFDQYATGFWVVQEVEPFGDLIACGQRFFVGGIWGSYSKGTLLRTTANGDSLWMFDYFYYDSLMTDGESTLRDVQPTPDGGFVAVGAAYGSISGNNPPGLSQDVWVIKVDSLGCIEPGCQIITGLESQVTNLKDAVRVWPNPVASGGTVTVQVQVPEGLRSTALRLVLANAQGQLVHEQVAVSGENVLGVSGLSAGLYHVHLANATTWLGGTKLIVE